MTHAGVRPYSAEDLVMKPGLFCVFVTVISVALAAPLPQTTEQSLGSLTRASHIIFVGRVSKLHATNLKVVPPTETTALVTVEELLDSPPSLVGLKGEEVTVELLRAGEVQAEQRAVFFTNGILFGEHLQVKEVGLLPVPGDISQFRTEIAALRAQIGDETLKERLASAVLVVTGRVLATRPLKRTTSVSEHEPDWAEAIIAVQKVEKGTFRGTKLTVYFPRSTDERWLLSPKFRSGQQGIWILHRETRLGVPQGALTALNPSDYHPVAEQLKIRKLLQ